MQRILRTLLAAAIVMTIGGAIGCSSDHHHDDRHDRDYRDHDHYYDHDH